MTRQEYFRSDEMKSTRRGLLISVIVGYAYYGLSFIANIIMILTNDNRYYPSGIVFITSLISTIIIAAILVSVHLFQSRVAACVYLALVVLGVLINFKSISAGSIIPIVLSGFIAFYTFRFQKSWQMVKQAPYQSYSAPMEGGGYDAQSQPFTGVCPKCGHEVDGNSPICMYCGASLPISSLNQATQERIRSQAVDNYRSPNASSIKAFGAFLMILGIAADLLSTILIFTGSTGAFGAVCTIGTICFIVGIALFANG